MKIAVIAPEFFPVPPVRGGATETDIHEVTQRMTGHEVTVFSIADPLLPLEHREGHLAYFHWQASLLDRLLLSSWKLPFKRSSSRFYYYPYLHWILARLRRIRPEVIRVHSRMHFVPWLRKAFPEARIILSLHNESNLRDAPVWNRSAIEACDLITACSQSLADAARTRYPGAASRLRVLYNGVDPDLFRKDPESESRCRALREKHGFGKSPVILFVGRLVEEKGIHVLLEVFGNLLKRFPDLKLVLAGSKTFSDVSTSPYIDRLRGLARPLGDAVVFTGHISHQEVSAYYQMADVLAFPSLWKEPFGMVVAEAMACELPVVAFDHGGPSEIITHGVNGILVPPEEGEHGLEEALAGLLQNPKRREMGEAARYRAAERFSWNRVTRDCLELLESLEAGRPGLLIAESGSGFGGTAKYLAQLAPLIPQDRWQVHLVAYARGPFIEELERHGWPIGYRTDWRFPGPIDRDHAAEEEGGAALLKGLLRMPARVPQIMAYLKARNIKVIHLNNEVLSHLPLVAAGKLAGCRILCHLHGWRPFTRLEKLALRFIDRLVCISDTGAAYFREQLGGREVVSAPNGIDPCVVPTDLEPRRIAERGRLGIGEDRKVFLLAGRLVPWKGQEVFLEALAIVREKHPGVLGLIVGHDPSPDGYYLKELKSRAAAMKLEDNVCFLGWQQDVWSLYGAADAVVHASAKPEPFGLVILEAMLAARPVIATRAGGVVDLIEDGVSGSLIPPGDAPALAQAISRYIEDVKKSKDLAGAGKDRALKMFTMKRNADKITALYRELA